MRLAQGQVRRLLADRPDRQDMMARDTPAQVSRVTQAVLKMKTFDIAALQRAYGG
jgi:hypothetical protein